METEDGDGSDRSESDSGEPFGITFEDDDGDGSSHRLVDSLYEFDFSRDATLVKNAVKVFVSSVVKDNFLKGCKWSPDGSCLLTNSEDKVLRVFNLPNEFYSQPLEPCLQEEMNPTLSMKESELIYDYCWYPKMTSLEPTTCFFLTTSRNNPIHMWDAYTGKIAASFCPYNHLDEVVSAYSLAFSPDGTKIYAGFKKSVKIFDTALPGRIFEERLTYANKSGQHGIISSIAVNPRKSSVYALGSYTKQIGLYEEPNGDPICILLGQKGGITQLMFSPDGTKLFSGGRRDSEILCWDMRNLSTILYSMKRVVETHQRVYFDITPDGRYLVTGSDDGMLFIYDLKEHSPIGGIKQPSKSFKAFVDNANGASWHPTLPLIATSSGQRSWPDLAGSDDEDHHFTKTLSHGLNSLSLWWLEMK
ncbi:telomerase Cajal body protein 1 homolog [Brevipalpus obovatus]|uniref:telomerase Cajal body protein 1 homolog n=1 Tax=Brevipalpus obovatus TaxID=246614 RepID=UPI003D9F095F